MGRGTTATMRSALSYTSLLALVTACCWGGGALDVPTPEPIAPVDFSDLLPPPVPSLTGDGALSWDPWDHPSSGVSEASFANERRHLPQLGGLRARFDAAAARRLDAFTGVLVCRVLLAPGGGGDLLGGGPDLYLRLTSGELVVSTDEGEGDGFFSVPVTSLAAGATGTLEVFDRDVLFDDELARAAVTFDGALPWHLDVAGDRDGVVECRGADDAAIEAETSAAIAGVDGALRALGTPHADLGGATLGWPVGRGAAVHAAMAQLSGLRGFAHPDVVARVAASDAVASAMRAEVARAVVARRDALPPTGDPVELGPGLTGITRVLCEGDDVPPAILEASLRTPCYVALDVTASEPVALDGLGVGRSGARWIDTAGHTALLSLAGAFHEDAPDTRLAQPHALAAGEHATLWWSAPRLEQGLIVFSFAPSPAPTFVRR